MSQPFAVNPAAFWILAALILVTAVAVVRARMLFHAGIALVACFLGVAGLYVTLQAHFVAGIQVLVYAGAIAVILLFAIMLTHGMMHPERGTLTTQPWVGLGVSLLVLAVLWVTVLNSTWKVDPDATNYGVPAAEAGHDYYQVAEAIPDLAALGKRLLDPFVLPFELVSALILVAMIGAIVIARKEERPPHHLDRDRPEEVES